MKILNWTHLAQALAVSRTTLYEWRRRPGAPTKPDDLDAWQTFAEELREARRVSPEHKELVAEKLKREIALLDVKLAKESRKVIPADEVGPLLNRIAAGQRADLIQWCETATLEPMPGADLGEVRDHLRLICDDLCDRMESGLRRWIGPDSES